MELNQVYFWTNTIKDWKRLLQPDKYKHVILQSWQELVSRGVVCIYGFVIMPNHLHIVWEMLEPNGKEIPHASFNKFTSHTILADLKQHHPQVLPFFSVDDSDRLHRVWQRDPLAILMDGQEKVEQKIEYMHRNPLHERWNLVDSPENYRWSSAPFYETGLDEWGILTHYKDRF
ncbi:transposase [Fibrella aquatilis]|uniref:Transposase n=1 Tax=Fibrella aquatilis TaxID=2817059 RepID=A0A939G580_9BACT|nr:transposase [Fibrella aquatilis]MBO0930246.1 transposase [Fibrella aquatilis]